LTQVNMPPAGAHTVSLVKIERLYTRHILATTRSATIAEAAAAMGRYRVGALLVMEDPPVRGSPIGIVTDRDLAVQGFASEASTVGSVMTAVVASVAEGADVHEALELMRAHGIRRLLVTGEAGALRGILSIDDVIDGLSTELAAATAVLRGRREVLAIGPV
jgi:CBS domain-containing protein